VVKLIQIVPRQSERLYGAIVKRQIAIEKNKRGTFHRAGRKTRNAAKWKHNKFPGWINIQRGLGEVVTVEVRSRVEDHEWQILSAFLGWLDRYCRQSIFSVSIHYL
jgi:hypothetical protein